MSTEGGYWEPHTSSVNFCEPDYALTSYLAEPFNAVSSLYIAWFGLVGLLYSNPMKEMTFTILFIIILFIGLGSFGLHATLHWLPQSFDEVPMLWYTIGGLYTLWTINNKTISVDISFWLFTTLAVTVTTFYYAMRSFYVYFIVIFCFSVSVVILWDSYLVWKKPRDSLIIKMWSASIFVYVCVASVIWIVDMHLCETLLPYYLVAHGLTFHVIWHVTAGWGAHLLVLTFILLRARIQGLPVHIEWVWAVPIVRGTVDKKKE